MRRRPQERPAAGKMAGMPSYFHVTSSRNRDSILRHGLDWSRMSVAAGIAGSQRPEQQGCFLCLDAAEVE